MYFLRILQIFKTKARQVEYALNGGHLIGLKEIIGTEYCFLCTKQIWSLSDCKIWAQYVKIGDLQKKKKNKNV